MRQYECVYLSLNNGFKGHQTVIFVLQANKIFAEQTNILRVYISLQAIQIHKHKIKSVFVFLTFQKIIS